MGLRAGMMFRGLLVHSKLGEGGMGEVYLVSHPILQTPFVVKIYLGSAGDVVSEAQLGARITSPHVVRVYDAGVAPDINRAFVVQRFVDGIDLDELVEALYGMQRRLPVGVVMRLIAEAARGLHAIHQAGVVHQDMKPGNLFMSGEGTASIGDFGIAICRDTVTERRDASAGTPHYMAPEQWRNEPVDRRADLYALGATAHHLALGEPPFRGETIEELAEAHTRQPHEVPAATNPDEAFLFAVIERLLRKARHDRYATAEQVALDLERLSPKPPRITVVAEDVAHVGSLCISLLHGDISNVANDVIVSAANCELRMDEGVSGALRVVGGDEVEREAREHLGADASIPMGTVVWTGAGRLSARWIAHAVAAKDGAVCLQRCCLRVLLGAEKRGAISVAIPALGTGIGQVPMTLAAKLMLEAFVTFSSLEPQHVRSINVLLYDEAALETWRSVLEAM